MKKRKVKTKRRAKPKLSLSPRQVGEVAARSVIADIESRGGLVKWYQELVAQRGW